MRFDFGNQIRAGNQPRRQCAFGQRPCRFQIRRSNEDDGEWNRGFHSIQFNQRCQRVGDLAHLVIGCLADFVDEAFLGGGFDLVNHRDG